MTLNSQDDYVVAGLFAVAGLLTVAAYWPSTQAPQSNPTDRRTIIVKGDVVSFELMNGEHVRLPESYGIIHDPYGRDLPKCKAYFGPFQMTNTPAEKTPNAAYYLGRTYPARVAKLHVPKQGPWRAVGDVKQIFYTRRGKIQPVPFYHPFKRGSVPRLYKCRDHYMLDLNDRCIVDDRGFVFP